GYDWVVELSRLYLHPWPTAAAAGPSSLVAVHAVATAPKSPTPALFFRELSAHPLLSSSSCRRLHLLAIVWSASSVNQGPVGVVFEGTK
ncbi:hypothetical protein S83_066959, partial [Arachis hypogaea]